MEEIKVRIEKIKFRAVEKPSVTVINMRYDPKMVYGTGIFEDSINTWLLSHDKTKCLADGFIQHIVDPKTIGEYIGIKDKNNNEIYVGDILKLSYEGGGIHDVCAVNFGEGCNVGAGDSSGYFYGYYLENIKGEVDSGDLMNGYYILEVIGNIYENPELLK